MPVRSNRGFTLIELLIVVATIGIVTSIAIPSFMRAQVTAITLPFEKHFGVSLEEHVAPNGESDRAKWLTDGQKTLLRPLVAKKLGTICADPTGPLTEAKRNREKFLADQPPTDPGEATVRLEKLREIDRQVALGQQIADQGAWACADARTVAQRLGLAPQ